MEYVNKGWGFEQIIVNNEKYCGKILHFWKGKKCSWHFHAVKDETFFVRTGELEVTYGETNDIFFTQRIVLKAGDSFHVPVGMRHQMKALMETEMFEFSTHDAPEDSIKVIKGD